MRCPVCEGSDLSISSREGVEIDFCPQCRGVWLDRGELDKVIDRAGAAIDRAPVAQRPAIAEDRPRSDRDDRYYDDGGERQYDPRRRRRRSFLDDMFDFD